MCKGRIRGTVCISCRFSGGPLDVASLHCYSIPMYNTPMYDVTAHMRGCVKQSVNSQHMNTQIQSSLFRQHAGCKQTTTADFT